jgi:hypothetical protein
MRSRIWTAGATGVAAIGLILQAQGENGTSATLGKSKPAGGANLAQVSQSGGQTVRVVSSSTNSHVRIHTETTGPDGKTVVHDYNSDGSGDVKAGPVTAGSRKTISIGISTKPIDETLRAQLDIEPETGLAIGDVAEDSPAAKAGLQKTDVLLRLGDQILVDPQQFAKLLRRHKPGDEVVVTYLRRGKQATTKVKVEEMDAPADVKGFGANGIDMNELLKQLPNLQAGSCNGGGNAQTFGFSTNFTFQTNFTVTTPGGSAGGSVHIITIPACGGSNP